SPGHVTPRRPHARARRGFFMPCTSTEGQPERTRAMKTTAKRLVLALGFSGLAMLGGSVGCSGDAGGGPTTEALTQRAYVVGRGVRGPPVVDVPPLGGVGRVATSGAHNHMAELNADFSKVYVSSPGTGEVVVVDARSLAVTKRIAVAGEPTHLALSGDGRL